MPWVLWDIVFPLMLTFALGLATGWLLWRWRRYKSQIPVLDNELPSQPQEDQTGLSEASATALIEERDLALARAEEAEFNAKQLSEALSQQTDNSNENSTDDVPVTPAVDRIKQLESSLAEEQTVKAELEQAFMDLNNRYSTLKQQNNVVSHSEDDGLKLQYESALCKIEDTEEELQATIGRHKEETDKLTQIINEKDETIKTLEVELGGAKDTGKSGNVHHLSSFSRGGVSSESTGHAGDRNGAELSASPSANVSSDSRGSRVSGMAVSATALSAADDFDVSVKSPVAADVDTETQAETETVDQPESVATADSEAVNSKTTASGYRPVAWQVPERTPGKSERDNLQKIKGVGPVLEKLLHSTGIYYFNQLAALDEDGVAELDSQLPQFAGRIQRDQWVEQAASLHSEAQVEATQG